jgi:hypothetical protein
MRFCRVCWSIVHDDPVTASAHGYEQRRDSIDTKARPGAPKRLAEQEARAFDEKCRGAEHFASRADAAKHGLLLRAGSDANRKSG